MGEAFETTVVGWLTIILGWVLTALALLSVVIYIWSKGVNGTPHRLDDILLYLSFIISLVLMSLTTWAVVVEGQGRHQSAESRSQFDLVAKVSNYVFSRIEVSRSYQTLASVTLDQRDPVGYRQYILENSRHFIHSQDLFGV